MDGYFEFAMYYYDHLVHTQRRREVLFVAIYFLLFGAKSNIYVYLIQKACVALT